MGKVWLGSMMLLMVLLAITAIVFIQQVFYPQNGSMFVLTAIAVLLLPITILIIMHACDVGGQKKD